MAKNMFLTYTNRHIFEQLDILHARRKCGIAFFEKNLTNIFIKWNEKYLNFKNSDKYFFFWVLRIQN